MTLKKLAEIAGTTVSTVSKAFRDSKEISKKTKEKIFSLAKEYGCFEKYYRGENNKIIVGIICPEPESETYGIAVGKIEKALYKRGANALIGISRFSKERVRELYLTMAQRARVDGIVVFGGIDAICGVEYVPTVVISEAQSEDPTDINIVISLSDAVNELVALLKKEGYRRIGFIGESLTTARLDAFKHAIRRNGLPLYEEMIFVAKSARFAEAGMDGMRAFINSGNVPEVIITAYDNIAFGAMRVAKENGFLISNDIEKIGAVVKAVVDADAKSVADYKSGKEKALMFLFGKCMKELKGNCAPQLLRAILCDYIGKI